jgi:hypothetical protein
VVHPSGPDRLDAAPIVAQPASRQGEPGQSLPLLLTVPPGSGALTRHLYAAIIVEAKSYMAMVIIHGTKKLVDRIPTPPSDIDEPTGPLGSWYATLLFWRPQVALLVDEDTYLPLLMPLAPAATLLQRFPAALETLLLAHNTSTSFIQATMAVAREPVLARTANRRALGVMSELAHLAAHRRAAGETNLVTLAVALARTPIGPLYTTHVSPDRALTILTDFPEPDTP